jgi:hypothetical protein
MSTNNSKMANIFQTLNRKKQNPKYNKKDLLLFFIWSKISGRKRRP